MPGLTALTLLFVAVVYLRFWQFGGFMLSYVMTTALLFLMLGLLLHRGVPRGLGWLADLARYTYALYMLHRTGDIRIAKEQLHTFPYLHMGWGRTDAMDRVLELYEPYAGVVDFGEWAATIYEAPR